MDELEWLEDIPAEEIPDLTDEEQAELDASIAEGMKEVERTLPDLMREVEAMPEYSALPDDPIDLEAIIAEMESSEAE